MVKNSYTWLKRELLIGFFFSPFIAFCFFGVDFNNTNLFIFQIIYLLIYLYFSYVFIKNTVKSNIPRKNYIIEFVCIFLMFIMALLYSLLFVNIKYINGEYSGVSFTHVYILIIFILFYISFAFFAIRNTKGYLW